MPEQHINELHKPDVHRITTRIRKGIARIVNSQVNFVSSHSLKAYDSLSSVLPEGRLKQATRKHRNTAHKVSRAMGYGVVALEGAAIAGGVAYGVKRILERRKHQASPVVDQVVPVPKPQQRIRREPALSPEYVAHGILVGEIANLQVSGQVSERLREIMYAVANTPSTTEGGKISFRDTAILTLEHLVGEGRPVLDRALADYAQLRDNQRGLDFERGLKRLLDNLCYSAIQKPGIDTIDLNWWNWAYRGIGLRELLGLPPEQKIISLDYNGPWVKPPLPYIEFVKEIMNRKPSSFAWAFQ